MDEQTPDEVGDVVRVLALPDGLLQDLPDDEVEELRATVGRTTAVEEVDRYGFIWVGFGQTTDHEDCARYSGHSFSLPRECIEVVSRKDVSRAQAGDA